MIKKKFTLEHFFQSFTVQIDEDNPNRRQSVSETDSSISGSSSVIHHSQVKQPPVLTEFLDRTERSFLIKGLKPAHAYNVTFNVRPRTPLQADLLDDESFKIILSATLLKNCVEKFNKIENLRWPSWIFQKKNSNT